MVANLPPRSEGLLATPMLLTFDVDCGEVLLGHRFIARGLSGPCGLPLPWSDEDDADDHDDVVEGNGAVEGEQDQQPFRSDEQVAVDMAGRSGYPAFALEYELVPGIPRLRDEDSFLDYVIGISYDADVPPPWDSDDGGAIAPYEGGLSTHGSRGAWPLPPDARVLTFTLHPPVAMSEESVEESDDEPSPAGQLVVDLEAQSARWVPGAPPTIDDARFA